MNTTTKALAHNIGITAILLASAAGAMALAALVYATEPADAHEAMSTAGQPLGWNYPWSCCASQDCRAALAGEITEGPDGYVVTATGEIVAYRDKRVKDSPDGEIHLCAHQLGLDAGHTICLFVPPKSF